MGGAVDGLCLLVYPKTFGFISVAGILILLPIFFQRDKDVRTGYIRLVVTNLLAAMALIQVFLPNVMQATRWAGGENVAQPLNLDLIKSTLSHLFLGVEYAWPRAVETEGLVSSASGMPGTSFAGAMILLATSAAVLFFTRLRRAETLAVDQKLATRHWLVLAMPVLSSILFATFVGVTGSYFYQRFVIAMLPCVIALLVMLFAESLADPAPTSQQPRWKRHTRRSLALLLLIFLTVKIAPFWLAQDRLLMTRPYAPLRDATAYVQSIASKSATPAKKGLIVCYGHGHEVMPLYLPEIQPALSRAELDKFINQARSEKRPLMVMQGHTAHNRASIPDGFTLLDDRSVFEELKAFPGIEPEFYFRVFQLK